MIEYHLYKIGIPPFDISPTPSLLIHIPTMLEIRNRVKVGKRLIIQDAVSYSVNHPERIITKQTTKRKKEKKK